MAINSVSSSTSANAQSVRPQKQPEQAQQTKPAAQEQAKTETKPQAEAPKPQPVVNTQGQKTGTVINITA
ncbi:MAG: hypothetical protein A2045_02050 [Rhodocyclales bacterium GWA2_65_20]|nr:MAG: hypothetical protein A2045_02050 [Rhodocyclales bacterium GWA2_65_20]